MTRSHVCMSFHVCSNRSKIAHVAQIPPEMQVHFEPVQIVHKAGVHVWIDLGSFLYICIARLFVYGDRVTDPFCPMFAHLTPEFTEAMSERIFLFNKVSISGNHFSFPGSFFGLKIESKTFFGDISPFVCVVLRSSGKSEGDDDDVL